MFENSTDDLILEKLLVLYTLNNIKKDINSTQLTQIILETEVMDYFTLQTLVPKIIEANFITTYNKYNTDLYAITRSGMEVLIYFQNRIPDIFKKKIDAYLIENEEELYSEHLKKQANYIVQSDTTCIVTLLAIKGKNDMMSINLNVDNEEIAKSICNSWTNELSDKYEEILSILQK
ncbi:DUF4364 family protein [Peptostreptococcus equinus]|uniref:DUF4364 family protein n=1 Tax=Peptostreptococcus equinus TaxID=3003601 RepID=A0ABY7JST1_9FIRM|nr:DUF4364 family protein [Peptostreptococcus sp. CBA3647]WAW15218.1 DUF4364 family protein [Peptostreptococcus sp. CBA3647]